MSVCELHAAFEAHRQRRFIGDKILNWAEP